jgi:gas vesicle protein
MDISYIILIGLILGFSLHLMLSKYLRWHSRSQAEKQARDLIESSNELAQELMETAKTNVSDYEQDLLEKHEDEFQRYEEKVQNLQSGVDRNKNQLHNRWSDIKEKLDKQIKEYEQRSQLMDAKLAKSRINKTHLLNRLN